jgi:hypothetical protein
MVVCKVDTQPYRDDGNDCQENAETNPSCSACVRSMQNGLNEIPMSKTEQSMFTSPDQENQQHTLP